MVISDIVIIKHTIAEKLNIDEFEIEFGDRLRSIGFDDSRLVFEAAHKAFISPEKGVDALVGRAVSSGLGDYLWIVMEDIGLFYFHG